MFILYDDDKRVLGLFSTKQKLDHAMNGHNNLSSSSSSEEMVVDSDKQILPVWEITFENNVVDPNKTIGPYYKYVEKGHKSNIRRSRFHEDVCWIIVQAETKEEDNQIAMELIKNVH